MRGGQSLHLTPGHGTKHKGADDDDDNDVMVMMRMMVLDSLPERGGRDFKLYLDHLLEVSL